MKCDKPTYRSAVICNHVVLPVPCKTEEELSRWLLSMRGKSNAILYIKQTDENRELFKDILSILSLRHVKKKKRDFLQAGYFGIACTKNNDVYMFIGGDLNGNYEQLMVLF